MNEYKKSNYAINKLRKGIVYRNDDGSILEVTFEKISEGNPTFTQEDFQKLKELSDDLYHEEAKNDCKYYHHNKSAFDENVKQKVICAGLDDEFLMNQDNDVFREKLKNAITTQLTPTQQRRFITYFFEGMTVREIADKENCYHNSVWKSISYARKKIIKFLKNFSV